MEVRQNRKRHAVLCSEPAQTHENFKRRSVYLVRARAGCAETLNNLLFYAPCPRMHAKTKNDTPFLQSMPARNALNVTPAYDPRPRGAHENYTPVYDPRQRRRAKTVNFTRSYDPCHRPKALNVNPISAPLTPKRAETANYKLFL